MPLDEHKIRTSAAVWALIENEAKVQGVSTSRYLIEAGFARAMYDWVRRGGGGTPELAELYDCARRFSDQYEAPN